VKIAVDVCIGKAGVRLLRWFGHDVIEAEHCEQDRDWFKRALDAGVELVISPDSDLEILAYDHRVKFYRPKRGLSGVEQAQSALRAVARNRL
jgi:hypothetical protein